MENKEIMFNKYNLKVPSPLCGDFGIGCIYYNIVYLSMM